MATQYGGVKFPDLPGKNQSSRQTGSKSKGQSKQGSRQTSRPTAPTPPESPNTAFLRRMGVDPSNPNVPRTYSPQEQMLRRLGVDSDNPNVPRTYSPQEQMLRRMGIDPSNPNVPRQDILAVRSPSREYWRDQAAPQVQQAVPDFIERMNGTAPRAPTIQSPFGLTLTPNWGEQPGISAGIAGSAGTVPGPTAVPPIAPLVPEGMNPLDIPRPEYAWDRWARAIGGRASELAEPVYRAAQIGAEPIIENVVQPAVEIGKKGLTGVLGILDKYQRKVIDPLAAGMWSFGQPSPEMKAKQAELEAQIYRIDQKLSWLQGGNPIWAPDSPEEEALKTKKTELERELAQAQVADYRAEISKPRQEPQGVKAAIMDALGYATPEETEKYLSQATPMTQFLLSVAIDPLNLVDLGGVAVAKKLKIDKISRAKKAEVASPLPLAAVELKLAKRGDYTASIAGRTLPWVYTPGAQAAALVSRAIDDTGRIVKNLGPGKLWEFINDPDSLVSRAGPWIGSEQSKETAVLIRKVLTPDGSKVPDPGLLAKIIADAKGDDIEAVAQLGRKYTDAAEKIFVPRERSAPTRARDWINNYLSLGFMGYNLPYAIRNGAGNLTHAVIDGVMPFTTSKHINKWWPRWGNMPISGKAGIGPTGSVWQTKSEAIDFITGLTSTSPTKDIFKGITPKGPTLQLGQNVERYFSERIVYAALTDSWGQVWADTLAGIEDKIPAFIGLSPQQIEYLVREWATALNPEELYAPLNRLSGSSPPPAVPKPVVPGPTGPAVTGVAGAVSPAAVLPSPAAVTPPPPAAISPVTGVAGPLSPAPVAPPSAVVVPPPGIAAPVNVPTPTKPVVKGASFGVEPGPGAPVVITDLTQTVPTSVISDLTRAAGDGVANEVVDAVRVAGSAEEVPAMLDAIDGALASQQASSEAIGQIHALASGIDPYAPADASQLFRDIDNVWERYHAQHDAARDQIWEATQGAKTPASRAKWLEYHENNKADLSQVVDETMQVVETVGPQVGLTPKEVASIRGYYESIVTSNKEYDAALAATWKASENAKSEAQRQTVWWNWNQQRQFMLERNALRRDEYMLELSTIQTKAAIASSGRVVGGPAAVQAVPGQAPFGAEPPPPPPGTTTPPPVGPDVLGPMLQPKTPTGPTPPPVGPALPQPLPTRPGTVAVGAEPRPAAVVPAEAHPAMTNDNELRRLASEARIATATDHGGTNNKWLENFIRKHVDPEARKLSDLGPEQRLELVKALQQRIAEAPQPKAPPKRAPIGQEPGPTASVKVADTETPIPPIRPEPLQFTPSGIPIEPVRTPIGTEPPGSTIAAVGEELEPGIIPGKQVVGNPTTAYGSDPNHVYKFRIKVVSLDDLIVSHSEGFVENPEFLRDLQPRIRDRAAAKLQVDEIVQKFQPDGYLVDTRTLDRGPMIVGPDRIVESGNGRSIALRIIRQDEPEKWAAYQKRLHEAVKEYGINPKQMDKIKDPVLVRHRLTKVDRKAFVDEANLPATLEMSAFEEGLQDARRIDDRILATIDISDSKTIEASLISPSNRHIIKQFVDSLPHNARGGILNDKGEITPAGISRLKTALFGKTYIGDDAERLMKMFTESMDSGIRNIEHGMFSSLPKVSKAESMIRMGVRPKELSLIEDISKSVDVLARLRVAGEKVKDYLGKEGLFARELSPFQEELLKHLDSISRSPKKVREFFNNYADEVIESADTRQVSMFEESAAANKEELVGRVIKKQAAEAAETGPLFAAETTPPTFGETGAKLARAEPGPAATYTAAEEALDPGLIPGARTAASELPPTAYPKTAPDLSKGTVPTNFGDLAMKPRPQNVPGIIYHPYDPFAAAKNGITEARRIIAEWRAKQTPQPIAPFTPGQAVDLKKWIADNLVPGMIQGKTLANRIATQARNFALGDYASRRNINGLLQWVFPYHFWYTFTYKNWITRFMQHPEILSDYARYKALLQQENEKWYRETTGDQNAELPPWWAGQVRIPFGGTEYWMDLEKTLNPIYAMVNDFVTRARGEAPGGEFFEKLGSYGPSVWSPIIWAYSSWLWQNGYKEAAAQWTSYLMPFSQPIKSLTAAAKELIPGDTPFVGPVAEAIPPGGFSWEAALGLPTVQGGSIWERNRISRYLYSLFEDGKISQEEMEKAAYDQNGPIWERAQQMEAYANALPVLTGFLLATGLKGRGTDEIHLQQMWEDWGDLYAKKGTIPDEQWNRLKAQFDRKYPEYSSVRLSREYDPIERLEDYTWMIIDRLPPGRQNRAVYEQAGIVDLLDRWWATEPTGNISGWTPEEQERWRVGIEKIADLYDVPSMTRAAEWQKAREYDANVDSYAVQMINEAGFEFTLEQIKEIQAGYYEPGINQDAYRERHPELQAFWDAQRLLRKEGMAAVPEVGGEPGRYQLEEMGRRATSPLGEMSDKERGALQDKYFTPEKDLAMRKEFGDDILEIRAAYGAMNEEERKRFRLEHPDDYARYTASWDWLEQWDAAHAEGSTARTGSIKVAPSAGADRDTRKAAPIGSEVGSDGMTSSERAARRAEGAKLFGKDILIIEMEYLDSGPKDSPARKLWKAENPDKWARLSEYWDWYYENSETGGGAYPTSGYPSGGMVGSDGMTSAQRAAKKAEAAKLFGSDIIALASMYTNIPKGEARKIWQQQNPDLYARLKEYWNFMYPEDQYTSNYTSGYRSYGGGGGGGGYGGGAPAVAPVTNPAVTPAPGAAQMLALESITPQAYGTWVGEARSSDPAFDRLVTLLFGGGVIDAATSYLSMSPEARAAFKTANQALWLMIMRYLAWLMQQQIARTNYTRAVDSMPVNAPIPPPVPTGANTVPIQ